MNTRPLLLTVVAVLGCSLATGYAQEQRVAGVVAVSAPVTLLPETGRTPLATLAEGTQIEVLGSEENGWYRISFQDSYLWGDRVGYVRSEHVRVSGTPPAATTARPSAPAGADHRSSRNGLSDANLSTAIAIGRQQKGARGLRLLDTGQRWGALPTAGAAGSNVDSRFRLQIHTPLAWIQQLASDAAQENGTFALANVTGEMTRPVLRVTAYSQVPASANANANANDVRVQHVVLRGESSASVVQPLTKEAYSEHILKATGGRTTFEGLRLTFPIDAVRRLRDSRGDRALVITVIDARGRETSLRLTKEHFADLPM